MPFTKQKPTEEWAVLGRRALNTNGCVDISVVRMSSSRHSTPFKLRSAHRISLLLCIGRKSFFYSPPHRTEQIMDGWSWVNRKWHAARCDKDELFTEYSEPMENTREYPDTSTRPDGHSGPITAEIMGKTNEEYRRLQVNNILI